jgi:hypothetical protein
MLCVLAACGPKQFPLEDAIYTEDCELGNGDTVFYLTVSVGDNKITFTVNTDETVLGKALLNSGIVEGWDGPYGLYIKRVNGISADYDKDKAYWAFYVDGEYATDGVDSTVIEEGKTYELRYTAD